jgi:hypothetical protein
MNVPSNAPDLWRGIAPPMWIGQVLYAAKGAFGKDGKDSEADGAAKFAESIKVCRRLSFLDLVCMHGMLHWLVEYAQRHPVCHKPSQRMHACIHTNTCTRKTCKTDVCPWESEEMT